MKLFTLLIIASLAISTSQGAAVDNNLEPLQEIPYLEVTTENFSSAKELEDNEIEKKSSAEIDQEEENDYKEEDKDAEEEAEDEKLDDNKELSEDSDKPINHFLLHDLSDSDNEIETNGSAEREQEEEINDLEEEQDDEEEADDDEYERLEDSEDLSETDENLSNQISLHDEEHDDDDGEDDEGY